jgi:hypothetical protein
MARRCGTQIVDRDLRFPTSRLGAQSEKAGLRVAPQRRSTKPLSQNLFPIAFAEMPGNAGAVEMSAMPKARHFQNADARPNPAIQPTCRSSCLQTLVDTNASIPQASAA